MGTFIADMIVPKPLMDMANDMVENRDNGFIEQVGSGFKALGKGIKGQPVMDTVMDVASFVPVAGAGLKAVKAGRAVPRAGRKGGKFFRNLDSIVRDTGSQKPPVIKATVKKEEPKKTDLLEDAKRKAAGILEENAATTDMLDGTDDRKDGDAFALWNFG